MIRRCLHYCWHHRAPHSPCCCDFVFWELPRSEKTFGDGGHCWKDPSPAAVIPSASQWTGIAPCPPSSSPKIKTLPYSSPSLTATSPKPKRQEIYHHISSSLNPRLQHSNKRSTNLSSSLPYQQPGNSKQRNFKLSKQGQTVATETAFKFPEPKPLVIRNSWWVQLQET